MRKLPEYVSISLEVGERQERRTVKTADYVRAKTKQLREFGYNDLDSKDVEKQLRLLLAGKKWTDVVGGFMEKDKPRDSKIEKEIKRAIQSCKRWKPIRPYFE